MNRRLITVFALVGVLYAGTVFSQTAGNGPTTPLGTVTINQPVMANGKPLPAGTYDVRLTAQNLTPLPGQAADAERWVEFVANGMVVGREVAVVMTPEAAPVGTGGQAARTTSMKVELLKGGDFLRVSTYRDGTRYLIHMPISH